MNDTVNRPATSTITLSPVGQALGALGLTLGLACLAIAARAGTESGSRGAGVVAASTIAVITVMAITTMRLRGRTLAGLLAATLASSVVVLLCLLQPGSTPWVVVVSAVLAGTIPAVVEAARVVTAARHD